MRAGIGNWEAFNLTAFSIDDVLHAAQAWASVLKGVERPWLCWNVNHDWCLAQQRLVEYVGWTPVVGYDPRIGRPPLTPRAICIDFNERFGFPVLYPHFVIEFAFVFAPRLAFWHSDLLLRRTTLQRAAAAFEALASDAMVATRPADGRLAFLHPRRRRYWELLGCMTRAASERNFESACGWWVCFWAHPNCPDGTERARRRGYYWDAGTGIRYWHRRCGGKVSLIPEEEISEGHFTSINNPDYRRAGDFIDWRKDLTKELALNFDLVRSAAKLDIADIVVR